MITSFEVGSIFKVIDEASPTLRLILACYHGIKQRWGALNPRQ
jgi:hypothetical protein